MRILAVLALLGSGTFHALSAPTLDKTSMTEILFEEREGEQDPYVSRVLILGNRMRMDFGSDGEDFILFDQGENTAWHVAKEARRMIGIQAQKPHFDWSREWTLSRESMASGENSLVQIRVNDELCTEYKSAPILKSEAALLRSFRQALAGNHARTWLATPEDLRHPCVLALDVKEAGVEFREGMLMAARYWDGRVRTYQSHRKLPARPELFQLPVDFTRVMVGGDQVREKGKGKGRQPVPSQRK